MPVERLHLRKIIPQPSKRVRRSLLRSPMRTERQRRQAPSPSRFLPQGHASSCRMEWEPALPASPLFPPLPVQSVAQLFFPSLIPPEIWWPKPAYRRRVRYRDKLSLSTPVTDTALAWPTRILAEVRQTSH